jgi:ubiquinone/menaquinone biosynthesis C-methylase UbiE
VRQETETVAHPAVERLSPDTTDYMEILYHWQRYLVAGRLARGKRIVDVASGQGYGADYLARSAERVCGVDLDPEAVKEARETYRRENLSFIRGSADRLPFASNTFDLATSFETIEHLPEETQRRLVEEIKRVLKPGGVLLISTPNKRRTEAFAQKNPYHLKEFYPEEFSAFLATHFQHVGCWVQEINLAAFSWRNGARGRRQAPWHSIAWRDGAYLPSDATMENYLYVIARCSDEDPGADVELQSVCFDVTGRTLESLWHDYLTQIDGLRRRVDDLAAESRRLETALAVARFESHMLRDEIAAREGVIESLRGELTEIRASRSWKLVEGYQHMMDRSLVGRVLRPIRDRVIGRRAG